MIPDVMAKIASNIIIQIDVLTLELVLTNDYVYMSNTSSKFQLISIHIQNIITNNFFWGCQILLLS